MDDFERLLEAVKRGELGEVEALVKGDAELVHKRDGSGATALHYAAFGGHCKVAEFLVQHGAEIGVQAARRGGRKSGDYWAFWCGGFLVVVERAVDSSFSTHDANARHEWGTHVLR